MVGLVSSNPLVRGFSFGIPAAHQSKLTREILSDPQAPWTKLGPPSVCLQMKEGQPTSVKSEGSKAGTNPESGTETGTRPPTTLWGDRLLFIWVGPNLIKRIRTWAGRVAGRQALSYSTSTLIQPKNYNIQTLE